MKLLGNLLSLLRVQPNDAAAGHTFEESVAKLSPDTVYVFDLERRIPIFTHQDTGQYCGYTARQVYDLEKTFLSIILSEEDSRLRRKILDDFAKKNDGEIVEFSMRVRLADGAWRWVAHREMIYRRLPDGKPIQILGISTDITELKLKEEKLAQAYVTLKQSEIQFRSRVENSPVGVVQMDLDSNCTFVNKRWTKITGMGLEQALGKGWVGTIHPEDRERVLLERAISIEKNRTF